VSPTSHPIQVPTGIRRYLRDGHGMGPDTGGEWGSHGADTPHRVRQ
jgi:hypothetical protein